MRRRNAQGCYGAVHGLPADSLLASSLTLGPVYQSTGARGVIENPPTLIKRD